MERIPTNPNQSEINRKTWKDPSVKQARIDGLRKKWWGTSDLKKVYDEIIRPLLLKGYTAKQIVDEGHVNVSDSSVKNVIKKYASEEDLNILEENRTNAKKKYAKIVFQKSLGHSKGKKYEDILGPEKAALKKKQASELWKTDNPRKYFTGNNISKGQLLLFEKVKEMFPSAVLEFPIDAPGKKYYLDIAVPELKLDFEYDGFYWHSFPDAIERDKKRDEYLKSLGWKVFRYSFNARNGLEVKQELDKLNLIIKDYDTN